MLIYNSFLLNKMNDEKDVASNENIIEIPSLKIEESEKPLTKLDIFKKISSGTALREGLNDIVSSSKGALIVISNPQVNNVFQGGFRVDCKFTSKRLAELAKMDGAIILSDDFKKILYANTLLIPDTRINSIETGTRHQAAERTSKQIHALTIAVSERKGEISIYYGDSKYTLQHTEDLLRRATETLQILEKQRDIFNELLLNMNVLEMTNLVSIVDVARILQRIEMVRKMANIINEYIVELGKDGIIVRIRLREIIRGVENEEEMIIKDYITGTRAKQFFNNLNFEELLDLENIAVILFKKSMDNSIVPKGYRMLGKTSLPKSEVDKLIRNFGNFDKIINSEDAQLQRVLGEHASNFKKEIEHLREQVMVGRRV